MKPFHTCEHRRASFPLLVLFTISLLISLCYANTMDCDGESIRWMTAHVDDRNHTGMKDDPFTQFEQVNIWLSEVSSDSHCSARLYLANGIYIPFPIMSKIEFTIASCLDCEAYPPDVEQIIFDVTTFDAILFIVSAPLTVSNVTFIGSLPSLYAQKLSEAQKSGLTMTEFVERFEPTLEAETRFDPLKRRTGCLFMVISSTLVLENIAFLSIEFADPIVNIYFGDVTLYRVIFARNRIVSDMSNVYRGGAVSSLGGKLEISESYFFLNYLIAHDKQATQLGGAAIMVNSGNFSLVDTGFKGNRVFFLNSHSDQFVQVSGGAVRLGDMKNALIKSCLFKDNMVVAYSTDIPTVGGALSFLSSGSVEVVDSIFVGNSADIGGAIGQIFKGAVIREAPEPPFLKKSKNFKIESHLHSNTSEWLVIDEAEPLRVLIGNCTIVQNKCSIRGCGISFNPSISRIHALVINSEVSHNEYYVNATKMCAQFSNPILQTGVSREIAGGVGISLFVRTTAFLSDRLTLRSVVLENNTVQEWDECVLGGGVAISIFGADKTILFNCIISGHNSSSSMNGIIWARQFGEFTMHRTKVIHNAFWLASLPTSTFSILDVQGDRERAIGRNTYSIIISDCLFEHLEASTIIRISTVRSILFQSTTFEGVAPSSNLFSTRKSYLHIEDVSGNIVMNEVTSRDVPYSHLISSVRELSIHNSTFQGYKGPDMRVTGHLTLLRISQVHISDSIFVDNLAGSLDATSSTVEIQNCYFANNYCNRPGCAIMFALGELWMGNSIFTDNQGTEGGAIMILYSTYYGKSLLFDDNHADSGNGGALCYSKSTGYLSNITCSNNFAARGGCFASPTESQGSQKSWSLFASDLVLVNNTVYESGGAIFVSGNTDLHLERAFLKGNKALLSGGAIAVTRSNLSISSAVFDSNSAGMLSHANEPFYGTYGQTLGTVNDGGGAISLHYSGLNLDDCHFSQNVARYVGGAIVANSIQMPQFSINRSTFQYCRAGHFAGAIYLRLRPSRVGMGVIGNSSFIGNQATYGGAFQFEIDFFLGAKKSSENIFSDAQYTSSQHLKRETTSTNLLLSSVSFTSNSALSGGAICTSEPADSYFKYQDLEFIGNQATITGGAFYYSNSISPSFHLPDFCNPEQCVAVASNSTHSKFGPIYGSIGWTVYPISLIAARPSTGGALSTTGAETSFGEGYGQQNSTRRQERPILPEWLDQLNPIPSNVTIHVYYGEYVLNLVAYDRYGQQVMDTLHTYTAHPEVVCTKNESHCPVIEILEGENSLRIQIMAPLSTKLPLEPYNPETENFASIPIQLKLKISFDKPARVGPNWSIGNELFLNLTVSKCPAGSGLQETSLSSALSSCYECPVNSYNYDGDGQCYLCNVWSKTPAAQMICAGSTVSYVDNYWATTVGGTNQLFVDRCLMGRCKRGQCSAQRTGVLCAECEAQNFESLFSYCSPTLCQKPNVLFLILVFVALLVISCCIHQFLPKWPTMTMFALFFAQMSIMLIQYPLDWALPRASPLIASLLCGFRTGPINRALFFMFIPYASLLILWVPWLLYIPVSLIFKRIEVGKAGRWFHWRRLLMTSIAISFTLTSNSLKQVLEWLYCMDTPMGKLWSVAPSVQCNSTEFVKARIFVLAFGFPLVLLPLGATLWFTITTTALPTWQLGSRQFLAVSGRRTLFHFLTSSSPMWTLVEIVLRILVPVTVVSGYAREAVTSSALGVLFAIGTGLSIPFSPFLLFLQRSSATISLSVLSIIGIFRGDLIFSKTPTAIIVIFCLILLYNLALLIVLIVGKPSEEPSINLESEWDRFSESEDEAKSLVSFLNSEPETDSTTEDLINHEDWTLSVSTIPYNSE